MTLRFASGSVDAGQAVEEPVGGLDVDQLDALVAAEGLDDLVALVLAHQPGVDEHAGELVADRPCTSAAATAESTPPESPQMARPLPTWSRIGCDRVSMKFVHRPRRRAARRRRRGTARAAPGRGRVRDLGVVLHAVDPPLVVLERRDGASGDDAVTDEPLGRLGDGVEVAHPHRLVLARRRAARTARRSRVIACGRTRRDRCCRPSPPSCWAISWAP